jgi:hypothetical protein
MDVIESDASASVCMGALENALSINDCPGSLLHIPHVPQHDLSIVTP